MQGGKKHGMQTLNDALYQLYMAREVTLEECLRVSGDHNEFLRMIGQSPADDVLNNIGPNASGKMQAVGGRR
jgi:twitching motility protein PilT